MAQNALKHRKAEGMLLTFALLRIGDSLGFRAASPSHTHGLLLARCLERRGFSSDGGLGGWHGCRGGGCSGVEKEGAWAALDYILVSGAVKLLHVVHSVHASPQGDVMSLFAINVM